MTTTPAPTWLEANQRYLMAALAEVRGLLERQAGAQGTGAETRRPPGPPASALAAEMASPPALETLCGLFGLSAFERQVLLACAGTELDSSFAALASGGGNNGNNTGGQPALTFSALLACCPGAHWSALAPTAPLRLHGMVELGAGPALVTSPLTIDERVLHYLTGVPTLDRRLVGLLHPVAASFGGRTASQQALAQQMASAWREARRGQPLPVVQITGRDRLACWDVAAAACDVLGTGLYALAADALPADARDLAPFVRVCQREAALSGAALFLDCWEVDPASDAQRAGGVRRFLETCQAPLALGSREGWPPMRRPVVTLAVAKPSLPEQQRLWAGSLGPAAPALNGQVDRLVAQFDLDAASIQSVATDVLARTGAGASPAELGSAVWEACRRQGRQRLDSLAQGVEPRAGWDDLVLPASQLRTLQEIARQVRHRRTVYQAWGFASKSARGLGISALFAGPSGTGKTLAAEVLARELGLDLYRIDLSSVVSKYIGETEKNLRRVFDAAEDGGAVLLFDEADALFGKRSEVKDSHDRYANIEVSYLLQRMETYQGLAILTTNLKSALDTAFLRRLRFVVQFPFPDSPQRAEIWRRIFPKETPTTALDVAPLARLNVSGGNIRNIAINAAFLAAAAGQPVAMPHLLSAARSEYAKLEKSLTDAELKGWA